MAAPIPDYVLVHGAWHGGWCWRPVAERLRAAGHRVFTPTCTGLGERAHLLSPDLTLDTFIDDIANVLLFEELTDVILVGHSFGGIVISGVAHRMPERIRELVFLDALIVRPGQTPFDILPPDAVAERRRLAQQSSGGLSLPPPPAGSFGIRDPDDQAWVERRLTPHPLSVYDSPLHIAAPVGNGLPCTYIACTEPPYPVLEDVWNWVREQDHWNWLELATGHDAMVSAPEELTRLLLQTGTDH